MSPKKGTIPKWNVLFQALIFRADMFVFRGILHKDPFVCPIASRISPIFPILWPGKNPGGRGLDCFRTIGWWWFEPTTHVLTKTWVFPKIGVPPKMDGLWWKTLLKWMIWGYHYFWKHPHAKNLASSWVPQSSYISSLKVLFRFWWLSSQPILWKICEPSNWVNMFPNFRGEHKKSLKPPPSFGLKLKTPNKKSSKPLGAGPCFGRICKKSKNPPAIPFPWGSDFFFKH